MWLAFYLWLKKESFGGLCWDHYNYRCIQANIWCQDLNVLWVWQWGTLIVLACSVPVFLPDHYFLVEKLVFLSSGAPWVDRLVIKWFPHSWESTFVPEISVQNLVSQASEKFPVGWQRLVNYFRPCSKFSSNVHFIFFQLFLFYT